MKEILICIAILLGGIAIFAINRYSRNQYEKEHGKPTRRDRNRAMIVYVGWTIALAIGCSISPFLLLAPMAWLMITSFFGIGFDKPGWGKDIEDIGIIATLTFPFWVILIYQLIN